MPNEYGSMMNQPQTGYMNQNIPVSYQQFNGSPSKLATAMNNMSLQNNQQMNYTNQGIITGF